MPDKLASEYKEADRRSGPNQENTERARAGVTGHNVRYVLGFGLLAFRLAGSDNRFRNCVPHLLSLIRGQRPNRIDIYPRARGVCRRWLVHRFD